MSEFWIGFAAAFAVLCVPVVVGVMLHLIRAAVRNAIGRGLNL